MKLNAESAKLRRKSPAQNYYSQLNLGVVRQFPVACYGSFSYFLRSPFAASLRKTDRRPLASDPCSPAIGLIFSVTLCQFFRFFQGIKCQSRFALPDFAIPVQSAVD